MSSVLNNMKATTQAVIDGYEKWETEAVMAPRADDCIHHVWPKSFGREPQNNIEYRAYFKTVEALLQNFKITVDREVWDVDARRACLHLYSSASSPIGEYTNEYSFFLQFNEDGTKVKRLEEMVDSKLLERYIEQLTEHMKTVGGEAPDAIRDAVNAVHNERGSVSK